MTQQLVEPIESQLRMLEPLSIVPAQSPEELALFDWLCARSLFPETGDTIITEEVRKFPSRK